MATAERIRVMIVDDQVTSRLLLADGLNKMGFKHVRVAKDGEEALAMLRNELDHLIISDFNMPKMNGIELLKAVRSSPDNRKVAFIMLTAQGDRTLAQQAAAYGANNILAKPFDLDKMRASIEAVFGSIGS